MRSQKQLLSKAFIGKASALVDETDNKYINRLIYISGSEERRRKGKVGREGGWKGEFSNMVRDGLSEPRPE